MNFISPPERCGRAAAVIMLTALLLDSSICYILAQWGFGASLRVPTGGLVVMLVLSLLLRERMAVHLALLYALMGVWMWSGIWPPFWPFNPLVPLVIYGLIAAAVPNLRRSVGWLKVGGFDSLVGWLVGITVVGSVAALPLWFFLLEPDLTHFLGNIPDWSPAWLVLAGLGFALLNAAVEEAIFRGVVMQSLEAAFGVGWLSLLIQAAAFGAIHFIGFPNGWLGVGMATLYGVMLGFIRRCSGGMLAPFATHVVADVVIFVILVCWVR